MKFRPFFHRLHSIPHPVYSHENWEQVQPCRRIRLGKRSFLLTQPLSTFWVYLLGIETIIISFLFLVGESVEQTHLWWFISLFLWGLGAMIAGTSYQAFGYYLKCWGREKCAWTNWWEIVYLLLQKFSVDAMLIAVSYSSLPPDMGRALVFIFTALSAVIYLIMVLYGSLKPVKKLISFEMMELFCLPNLFFMIVLNGTNYYKNEGELDLHLLLIWISLLLIIAAYYLYFKMGWTQKIVAKENLVFG